MAGITLSQAEAQLAAYLEAETKVLSGQAYELEGRKMTRANLAEIQQGIRIWDQRVKEISSRTNSGSRARTIAPGW